MISWVRPKAGAVPFPRFHNGGDLCRDLLEKKGVLIAPGSNFGHGDSHFRIGFGRKNMADALGVFAEYLTETG